MAAYWNNASLWSTTLLLLACVYMCWGCTPTTRPSTEEKIYFSDYMVHGVVLDIYKGGYDYDTLYTVNLRVNCIFKGDILDPIINITYAGARHEPGLCISNNFTVGGEYLVYLDQQGKELRPSFDEDVTDDQLMEDIVFFCDVEISEYPKGITVDTAEYECPTMYPDYEGCIKYTTPAPTPEATESPDVVVKTLAPEDNGNGDVSDETKQQQTGSLEGSGAHVAVSLGVMALCLVLSML